MEHKDTVCLNNQTLLGKRFWNWDIHYACNYRCSYCFLAGKWDVAAKENRYPGLEKWKEVWNRIYKEYGSCHIHFSGGEPFTYPDFIELIVFLSEKHTLEFSTNLSFNVKSFIETINPLKVKLGASFHPEFAVFEEFFEKSLRLKENGYQIHISFVAYPPQLKDAKAIKAECEKKKIRFVIQPFRGKYKEQIYPDNYTVSEKELIKSCGGNLATNEGLLSFQLNQKQKKEKLCHMGQMYGKVYASADVYRCCSSQAEKIGNLLDEADFRLFDDPAFCKIENCFCWRRMVVGEEESWSRHWK